MTPNQLKNKMEKLGITQSEMADICGVKQAQVSLVLAGFHDSKKLLQKIQSYIKAVESKLAKIK